MLCFKVLVKKKGQLSARMLDVRSLTCFGLKYICICIRLSNDEHKLSSPQAMMVKHEHMNMCVLTPMLSMYCIMRMMTALCVLHHANDDLGENPIQIAHGEI